MSKIIGLLITIGIISLFSLNQLSKPDLKGDPPTILEWQLCIERSILSTCDLDDSADRADCYNTAAATSKCYSETSPNASHNCFHWWIYFESSKSDSILPNSFYKCSSDCMVYAKQNKYYFQNYYSKFWITCALPN